MITNDFSTNEHVIFIHGNLSDPFDFGDGNPVFSAALGIEKSDVEQTENVRDKINDTISCFKSEKGIVVPNEDFISPLKDGDIDKVGKDEYKDKYYINAYSRESDPPVTIDLEKNEIDAKSFTSGDTVKCVLSFFGYAHGDKYGVGVRLKGVKLVRSTSSDSRQRIIDAL